MSFEPLHLLISNVLLAAAVCLAILAATLIVELIGALALRPVPEPVAEPPIADGSIPAASYVVIIPAHNEVGTIEHTLSAVLAQSGADGRTLVVADNCSDETAVVAAAAGANVIVRHDRERRGKGYALDFAVRSLAADPPEFVIILDADCIPEPGTIHALVTTCRRVGRPVQARYELIAPEARAGTIARVGAFAWRVKNVLRPTGLANLGVPCLLTGSGMAFPYAALRKSDLETGHLVEDMVLGLDLAVHGQGPYFLPQACVRSALPPSIEGQTSQRTRWETGHFHVISRMVPWLMVQAVRQADWRLFFLALHVAVPPLAFLVLTLGATTVASAVLWLAGGPATAFLLSAMASCSAAAVFAVYWYTIGRDLLTSQELMMLPGYVLSKLSMYGRVISGRKLEWIRSKRD